MKVELIGGEYDGDRTTVQDGSMHLKVPRTKEVEWRNLGAVETGSPFEYDIYEYSGEYKVDGCERVYRFHLRPKP